VFDTLLASVADSLERDIGTAGQAAVKYYHDPIGFARHCIAWPAGKALTFYQDEILGEIPVKKRVAVRGPHGLGKCLHYHEWMRLADGTLVQACDLVGRSFEVLAVDPITGDVHRANAYAVDNGVQPVVRVTTDKGRAVVRTLNHPMWADVDPKGHPSPLGRGRMRPEGDWVAAGELRPGSVIAAYLGNEGATETLTESEATILGGLVADGGLTGGSVIFSQADGPMLDAMGRSVAEHGCRLVHISRVDYRVTTPGGKGRRTNPVKQMCRAWGIYGHSALTKRLPALVWRLDDKSLALLLNRMFACDGWAHHNERAGNRANREVGYGTSSRALAEDVQRALLRLGIVAEVRARRVSWTHLGVRKHGESHTVAIHDAAGILRFAEVVGILGKEDALNRLAASCRVATLAKQQRWQSFRLPSGFAWERVRTVEVLAPEPTVAITVPGPHTFVTDFIEHNTTTIAIAILWFALTRESAGRDWKCVTTAGAWRQLERFTWPEIHKWARLIRWDELGREPLNTQSQLLTLNIKLRLGSAFAVASDNPELIEGAHADSILYVFDESKAIAPETFDAAEGAFSGAGEGSSNEAFAIAMSTPGEPNGRFYDIHRRAPGFDDWWVRHVTREEAIRAGRITEEWCRRRWEQWGDSAVYYNRVEGEFHSSDEDGVIPLSWVEQANERWRTWDEAGRQVPEGRRTCGVDVARSGSDKTVISIRLGDILTELRRTSKEDTMQTTGRVRAALANPDHAGMLPVVDVIGIGAGVVDRLREQGITVEGFNASEKTKRRDATREMGFTNCRSAAWWNMREMLDPSRGLEVALPPDDKLTGDLTAPHWRVVSGGNVQVESKDDIKKRLGRSPDDGDSAVMAFWPQSLDWFGAMGIIRCDHCAEAFVAELHPERCPHCHRPRDLDDDDAEVV